MASKKHIGKVRLVLNIIMCFVIIGLIVGGLLPGCCTLIHVAGSGLATQMRNLDQSIHSYYSRHGHLPGDTNGDGVIAGMSSSGVSEEREFWQQLDLEEDISGGFGKPLKHSMDMAETKYVSYNLPTTKFYQQIFPNEASSGARVESHLYWTVKNFPVNSQYGLINKDIFYAGEYTGNYVILGGASIHSKIPEDNDAMEPIFTPSTAHSIDSKFDDGKPATGRLRAIHWKACTTSKSADDVAGEYKISDNAGLYCALIVKIQQ